jgi:SAM-dependent methyltransferase
MGGPREGRGRAQLRENLDPPTVAGFGREWASFDQSNIPAEELERRFKQYFRLFPWRELPAEPIGFDLGCGSGRWARYAAPRVGTLYCIDASAEAICVAKRTLANQANCVFCVASVDSIPIPPNSMDFGYSLGVLHHIPDTAAGIESCAKLLKVGAPLLLYLYYTIDQRPSWFRAIWHIVNAGRLLISKLPHRMKLWITFLIAALIYLPLALLYRFLARLGMDIDALPLSTYRDSSFYTMRTDAFDRFSTRLEKRFTAPEIRAMMEAAGLERVSISTDPPYWCAIGYKRVFDAA